MAYDDPRPFGLQSIWVARNWISARHVIREYGYVWAPPDRILKEPATIAGTATDLTIDLGVIVDPHDVDIFETAAGTGSTQQLTGAQIVNDVANHNSQLQFDNSVFALADDVFVDYTPAQRIDLRAAQVTAVEVYDAVADDQLVTTNQVLATNILFAPGTDVDTDGAVLYLFTQLQTSPVITDGDALTVVLAGEARHIAQFASANSMTFSHSYKTGEMQGNDRIVAVATRLASLEGDVEAGGIDYDALEIMLGQDITRNAATATTSTFAGTVNPYFKLSGVVTDPNAQGSTEAVIYRAKINSLEGSFSDAEFFMQSGSVMAIKSSDTADEIYDLFAYETQVQRDLNTF